MNAIESAQLARRLRNALQMHGILVERADVIAGNVKGWEPVPAEGIIGRWLQNGWRVMAVDPESSA